MQDRFDAYNDALSVSDKENEELRTRLNSYEWQPIATFLDEDTKGPWTSQYLLAHSEKKWRRFGRFDRTLKRWYYSGTDERSQWSQVEGDAPTHWMRIPELPKHD